MAIIMGVYIAALATPWWINTVWNLDTCTVGTNWGWQLYTVTCSQPSSSCTFVGVDLCAQQKQNYDQKNWRTSFTCSSSTYVECNILPIIFDSAAALTAMALLLWLLVMLLFVGVRLTSRLPTLLAKKHFHFGMAVTSLIFALVSGIVFATAIPAAYNNNGRCNQPNVPGCQFFGSVKQTVLGIDITASWGPAEGWILNMVNVGLILIFLVIFWCKG